MDEGSRMADDDSVVGVDAVVEDVVLTDAFLVKGTVEGKFSRLFKVLEDYRKDFLVVSNAVMVDLCRGDVIRTPRVHINLDELLLAHELVDGAGDYYQKTLSEESRGHKSLRIRAFFNSAVSLEVAGRIRPGAYDGSGLDHRFFVMEDCSVRGLDLSVSPDLELVTKLSYAIINRHNIAYLYDFSEMST
jgi:hypothetical protein